MVTRWRSKAIVWAWILLGSFAGIQLHCFASKSVTLAWDPSPDPNVAGYNIYYGPASGQYTNVVSVGNTTNGIIDGLIEGATYYFTATAYDLLGLESDFSNEISYSVPTNSTPPNGIPVISMIPNLTVNEGESTAEAPFTIGDPDTPAENLSLAASSSNPSLVPVANIVFGGTLSNRTVRALPMPAQSGSATITITVNDPDSNFTNTSFVVTVIPNQPPTLGALSDLVIDENATEQKIALSGVTSGALTENQTLTVTASSSNPNIISNPAVEYTSPNASGALTFTPERNAFGSTVITVSVNDGMASNNIVSHSFTVTVNPVNQAPTLDPLADLILNENADSQTVTLSGITAGPTNENQTLTVEAVSSDPSLIPNPLISYANPDEDGVLTFTPATNTFGQATITVSVNDGMPSNNIIARSFTVTINAAKPPTLDEIPSIAVYQNSGTVTIPLTGITAGTGNPGLLTINAISCDHALARDPVVDYCCPATNGTLTVVLSTNACGKSEIVVTANNGEAMSNTVTRVFRLISVPRSASGPSFVGMDGGALVPPQDGRFQFMIIAPDRTDVTIQASDDLVNWTDVETVPIINGLGTFTDPDAGAHPIHFYRPAP